MIVLHKGRLNVLNLLMIHLSLPLILWGQTGNLTVVTYNMLNFPSNSSTRIEHFETVLSAIDPDILVAQEIQSQAGVDMILNDILRLFGQTYVAGEFIDEGSLNNAIFYKSDRVSLESVISIDTDLRDINGYEFSIDNHADPNFRWTLFSAHLKASSGSSNAYRRWLEVAELQDYVANQVEDFHYAFAGDFNVYSSSEAAYTLLLDSMTVSLEDPINARDAWHDNPSYADIHTQSTRTTESGGSGLDDRFDFILLSHQMFEQSYPLSYVQGTYEAYGNDGQHFNKNINDAPTNSNIPPGMADALFEATDHLPVFLQLEYPATGNTIDVIASLAALPNQLQLLGNYPNPFNPTTRVQFSIPSHTTLTVRVFNLTGNEIATIHDGSIRSGYHELLWSGRDELGQPVASGIYIVNLMTPDYSKSMKIVLAK